MCDRQMTRGRYIPWTKAPSSGCLSAPSGLNVITAVEMVTLSSAHSFFLAVTCITAVTNAIGLKNPPNQMLLGMIKVSCHFWSCSIRKIRSTYQSLRTARDVTKPDCLNTTKSIRKLTFEGKVCLFYPICRDSVEGQRKH